MHKFYQKNSSHNQLYLQALIAFQSHLYPQALFDFNKLLTSKNRLSQIQKAIVLFNIGLTHDRLGQKKEALQAYRLGLQMSNEEVGIFLKTNIQQLQSREQHNLKFQSFRTQSRPPSQVRSHFRSSLRSYTPNLLTPHQTARYTTREQFRFEESKCSSRRSLKLIRRNAQPKRRLDQQQSMNSQQRQFQIIINSSQIHNCQDEKPVKNFYESQRSQQDLVRNQQLLRVRPCFRRKTDPKVHSMIIQTKETKSDKITETDDEEKRSQFFFYSFRTLKKSSHSQNDLSKSIISSSQLNQDKLKLLQEAFILYKLGQFQEARLTVRRNKLFNEDGRLLYCKSLWKQGKQQQAINCMGKFLIPTSDKLYSELGWMLVKAGYIQQGIFNIEKALSLNSSNTKYKMRLIKSILGAGVSSLYQEAYNFLKGLTHDANSLILKYRLCLQLNNVQTVLAIENDFIHTKIFTQLMRMKANHYIRNSQLLDAYSIIKALRPFPPLLQFSLILKNNHLYHEASHLLSQLLRLQPQNSMAYHLFVGTRLALGQKLQQNQLKSVSVSGIWDERKIYQFISNQIQKGKCRQALFLLKDSLAILSPLQITQLSSLIYFRAGKYGKAVVIIQNFQEFQKTLSLKLRQIKARSHLHLCQFFSAQTEYLRIFQNYNIAEISNLWQLYFELGVASLKIKNIRLSLNAFEISLKLHQSPKTLFNIANIYAATQHLQVAIQYYRRALKIDKDFRAAEKNIKLCGSLLKRRKINTRLYHSQIKQQQGNILSIRNF